MDVDHQARRVELQVLSAGADDFGGHFHVRNLALLHSVREPDNGTIAPNGKTRFDSRLTGLPSKLILAQGTSRTATNHLEGCNH